MSQQVQRPRAEMTRVNCPLCGGSAFEFERVVDGFTLERCGGCDLVIANPQYTSESLMKIYKEKDDPQALIDLYARLATPSVIAEYDRKLSELEAMLGGTGRILDFACAAGYFTERAARKGWDAHGVDLGAWAKDAAVARGVRNIHIGHLKDFRFPDEYFDVIYAAQVLEHLQSPLNDLAEIRRILRRGGILYVDVPNYRTIPVMLNKDDFYLNSPPQHINYFSPNTLRRLLDKSGFNVHQLTTEGGIKWENLLGRPIVSDIADAYRNPGGVKLADAAAYWQPSARLKKLVMPIVKQVFYVWAMVGTNLVAFARRPTPKIS